MMNAVPNIQKMTWRFEIAMWLWMWTVSLVAVDMTIPTTWWFIQTTMGILWRVMRQEAERLNGRNHGRRGLARLADDRRCLAEQQNVEFERRVDVEFQRWRHLEWIRFRESLGETADMLTDRNSGRWEMILRRLKISAIQENAGGNSSMEWKPSH